METKLAKMLLQLFAEDKSDTTDLSDDDVDTEELEDNEDLEEDTEESETEEEDTDSVPETKEEPEKVNLSLKDLIKQNPNYQDELDKVVEGRLNRERNKISKEYESKLSKYEELAYLAKEGLKAEDYDTALSKARKFYGDQGIKYVPEKNSREEEILANAEAKEIIDDCDNINELDKEVDKLLSKGINITSREKLIAKVLISEMKSRKKIQDLAKLGVSESIYNSKEFKDFESKFNEDTPIADIYDLYEAKVKPPKKVVENPGSLKTIPTKVKKDFITEAEYDKMTDKEIEENMDLIHKSMSKW